MNLLKKKPDAIKLKSDITEEISAIDDTNLLKEISDFLKLKKQMKQMETDYGNKLYDNLNNENEKKLWINEKNIYIDLVKLLKNLRKERRENPGIKEIDKDLFDPNEPAIKNLLSKSLFVEKIGLEERIKRFIDQKIRLGNHYNPSSGGREHYVEFMDGKLHYDQEIWD